MIALDGNFVLGCRPGTDYIQYYERVFVFAFNYAVFKSHFSCAMLCILPWPV